MIGDRLFALSQACIQSVDIADRDNPAKVSQVDFFEEAEMPYYADDCHGWYPVDIGVPGGSFVDLLELLQASGMCGTATPAAVLAMTLTLTMVKLGARRRRRR